MKEILLYVNERFSLVSFAVMPAAFNIDNICTHTVEIRLLTALTHRIVNVRRCWRQHTATYNMLYTRTRVIGTHMHTRARARIPSSSSLHAMAAGVPTVFDIALPCSSPYTISDDTCRVCIRRVSRMQCACSPVPQCRQIR
jgi:hypothetical protein